MAQWLCLSNKLCLKIPLHPQQKSTYCSHYKGGDRLPPPVGEEARIWEHEYIIFTTEGWTCWGGNAVLNRLDRRAGDARKNVANSLFHIQIILSNLTIELNIADTFPSTLKDQPSALHWWLAAP